MLDPDHEIRGALGHPDPYIMKWGGGGGPPNFFGVCSKNKGGTAPPRAPPLDPPLQWKNPSK